MRVIDDPNGWKAGRNKGLAGTHYVLVEARKPCTDYAREIATPSFE